MSTIRIHQRIRSQFNSRGSKSTEMHTICCCTSYLAYFGLTEKNNPLIHILSSCNWNLNNSFFTNKPSHKLSWNIRKCGALPFIGHNAELFTIHRRGLVSGKHISAQFMNLMPIVCWVFRFFLLLQLPYFECGNE